MYFEITVIGSVSFVSLRSRNVKGLLPSIQHNFSIDKQNASETSQDRGIIKEMTVF